MRDVLSKVRLRPDQTPTDDLMLKTYSTAMRTAADEMLMRWKGGITAPQPNPYMDITKVLNKDGQHIGFNVYIVWGEPVHLGQAGLREEIE